MRKRKNKVVGGIHQPTERYFGGDKVLNKGSSRTLVDPGRSKHADVGKTFATAATWAMSRMQGMPRAASLVETAGKVVVITEAGMEAVLRDAFAAGAQWAREEGA